MVWHDFEPQLSLHGIAITPEEAMLLDWVLTMHVFNETQLDWLMKPDVLIWRMKAGSVVCGILKTIFLNDDDIKLILTLVPITFCFAKVDVGYSLKKKLYQALLETIEEVNHESETFGETSKEEINH